MSESEILFIAMSAPPGQYALPSPVRGRGPDRAGITIPRQGLSPRNRKAGRRVAGAKDRASREPAKNEPQAAGIGSFGWLGRVQKMVTERPEDIELVAVRSVSTRRAPSGGRRSTRTSMPFSLGGSGRSQATVICRQ